MITKQTKLNWLETKLKDLNNTKKLLKERDHKAIFDNEINILTEIKKDIQNA